MTLEARYSLMKAYSYLHPAIRRQILKDTLNGKIDSFKCTNTGENLIISINIPGVSASCLQEAVRQLSAAMLCTVGECSSLVKSINDLQIKCENVYPILKDKKHNKHGWYRKFEKKMF